MELEELEDSGVHAEEQVAHFDLKKKIEKKNLSRVISKYVGVSISVFRK